MVNPQWLRTFSAAADLGNFTRAADQLGLTQAAVSQHILRLEKDWGALFIRHPRHAELTAAGHALLDYCHEMSLAQARLANRVKDTENGGGEFSLISPGSIGLLIYPTLLSLQETNPDLTIRHRFAPDAEVIEAVLQNHYELGICAFRPDDPRLTVEAFVEEALELVVPASANVWHWSDLEQLGFIDHPDGQAMATRLLSLRFPKNPGIRSIPCRGFVNQIGLILEPVARGLGFTILPRYARQAFAKSEAICVSHCKAPITDTLWLIHRSEWQLPNRSLRIANFLRERILTAGTPEETNVESNFGSAIHTTLAAFWRRLSAGTISAAGRALAPLAALLGLDETETKALIYANLRKLLF